MRLLIAILVLMPWLAQAASVANFPAISLNAQTNVLSANATNLTFTGGYTTLSNNVKVFSIGYPSGDLSIIKSVPYSWPTSSAAGSLQNDGSGNLTWGGSVTFSDLVLTNSLGTVQFSPATSVTNLELSIVPSELDNHPGIYIGSDLFTPPGLFTNNIVTVGIGASPYSGATVINSSSTYGFGDGAFHNTIVSSSSDSTGMGYQPYNDAILSGAQFTVAIGDVAFSRSRLTNSVDTVGIGDGPFFQATLLGTLDTIAIGDHPLLGATLNATYSLMAIGTQAFQNSHFTNSQYLMAIGPFAGDGDSGSPDYATAFGPYSHITNSWDMTFGCSTNNYFFPGASTRFIKGLSSLATDAAVSGTSTGWTNTFGKAAVIRFDGSALVYNVFDNAVTSIYTNTVVVGHGETIIQASGKILFTSGSVSQWVAAPF